VEVLHLQRSIWSDPGKVVRRRQSVAVAGFEPAGDALALEFGLELIAEGRDAVGREPLVGKRKCRRCVPRPAVRFVIDTSLERIAPAVAEALCEVPIGPPPANAKPMRLSRER
jgi:hypothetical protein